MAKIILLSAFYSQLEYLTIGTPVPGCHWLWCLFFPLPAFSSCSLYQQTASKQEGGIVSSGAALNFIVTAKSEQAAKDS